MPIFRALVCLLGFALAPAAAADSPAPADPTIADFARSPRISEASLSPKGDFLAALATNDDQTSLVIYKTATRAFVSGLKLADGDSVLGYHWSGPDEVVAELGSKGGTFGEIIATGELMLLDAEAGAKPSRLISSSSVQDGFARLIDATPDKPDSILVSIHIYGGPSVQGVAGIEEMDTRNGKRRRVALAPQANCSFVTDNLGALRFAVCADPAKDSEVALYRYQGGEPEWVAMPDSGATKLLPWFVSRDNRWVYFSAVGLKGSPSDAACLARQPLDGSAPLAIVSCQAGSDVLSVISSADGNEALAAYYEADRPQLDFLESQHPDGALLLAFQQTFDGQLALPVSASRDGIYWLLLVGSDRRPGAYYLYNRKTGEASKLFERYPQLANSSMQPVLPLQFKARDGVLVHGYLTLPKTDGGSKPPLVVMPHGGPFGIRDGWGFDPEVQLLALRGYAVLRVNFRGSGGYGYGFEASAYRQWGTVMIDDITDAVRYVINRGQVDGDHVGIFGASYGGYAALMSAVREPALYKAVITYAGVADLALLMDEEDLYPRGMRILEKHIGKDNAELRKQSPVEYLSQLQAPILIVHGEADTTVPYSQAKRLRAALKKINHPYEWLIKSDEGHGFQHHANRVELYEKMLAFFGKHLGTEVQRPSAQKPVEVIH